MPQRRNQTNTKPWTAVIGPGAIGGLVAARLGRTGHPVILVGRDPKWRKSFKTSGLRVSGGIFGSGNIFRADDILPAIKPAGPTCSAVFVCVKSADTAAALHQARRLVGPETAVVSLQNGLTHRNSILRSFGKTRAVFGISFVAGDRTTPLNIRHSGGNEFVLAPHPGNAVALKLAAHILRRSGWKVSIVPSEDRLLWTKAAFNAASNPLGALTHRTNGELVRIPALKEILLQAAQEAAATARAAGHPLLYKDVERTLELGCLSAPDQVNSMLQDLRAGRRTEVDAIVAPFLAVARRKGIATPVLQSMHRFIKGLEKEICR